MKTAKRTSAQQTDATFAASDPGPIDAQMWPHSTPSWLQPELSPSLPAWTGLAIERHFAIPAPGFIELENAHMNQPAAITLSDAIHPRVAPQIPASNLAPLGWDPRTIARQQGPV